MEPKSQQLETEVKLLLHSHTDYLKLIGCLGPIDEEREQQNGFYDSADHKLAGKGWALRVRAEMEKGLVTLKGSPEKSASFSKAVSRREIEEEIDGQLAIDILESRYQLMNLHIAPIQYACELLPGLETVKYIQFSNLRRRKKHCFGDKNYVLEIDHTRFADGSSDYELEVEIDCPESADEIECHLRHLFGTLGILFELQPKSKLERALEKSANGR